MRAGRAPRHAVAFAQICAHDACWRAAGFRQRPELYE